MSQDGLRHNRDYVSWVVGETLSTFGTSLSTFAYPLLVLFATGSAGQTGIAAAASNVGSLTTLLAGGVLADRYPRRVLLVAGSLIQCVAVGTVAVAVLAGHVVLAHIVAAAFVDGLVAGATRGATNASLRRIVPAEQFSAAAAQLHGRDEAVRIVGPALGGLLFSLARWIPFAVDAVSYVAAAIGIAVIRRPLGPDAAVARTRESVRTAVQSGLRFILANPFLRFGTWWAALMNVLASGTMLLVVLLLHAHGSSASVIGFTRGAGAAGGIAGALVATRAIHRFPGRALVLGLTWALAGSALMVAALPNPVGIAVALAAVGLFAVPLNVMFATYEVQLVPDALLGRVSTALDLSANALRWSAPIAVGLLVEATSARTAAFVWAGAFALVAVLVALNRSLRVFDQPVEELQAG